VPDAVEVATELVENAIIHAGTELRLRLELHNDRLAVAVSDGSPREAVLCEGNGEPAGGLRLIAELATAWGCAPDAAGGKVVWAVLSARPYSG
jgi:anti-sigma regulatory factor (Ser/Thr protein kinase)